MSDLEAVARPRGRPDRGFALAVSIFALVIIAGLVTGTFLAARQELKIGLNSRSAMKAFSAAEAGLNSTVAQWDYAWNNLATGATATITPGTLANSGTYSGTVRRLNNELFLVQTQGVANQDTSVQRTVATLLRLQQIQMNFNAALTVRGNTTVGGSSMLDGRDIPPTGWSACPTTGLDTLPGIILPSTSGSSINLGNVVGDPQIVTDPTINDSTFFKFGELDWNELVAMATVTGSGINNIHPGPVGTSTTCTTSDNLNWGDPQKPAVVAGCATYFPIIHWTGNLNVSQGMGQGILLVDGDIEVSGQFQFYGPVIARGHLKSTGTGNHFWGGVMAADVNLEQNTVLGNAVVSYSSCALTTALRGNAPGRMLRSRSWAEVF